MSKDQLVQAIREVNPTASVEFLQSFQDRELVSYLRRLTFIVGRRGRESYWIREGDTHAVVTNAA